MPSAALLIDTDPGVDDALALLMAFAHAEVAGLSIAAGNVGLDHTLRNARIIAGLAGVRPPIFPGCTTALVRPAAEDAAFVHGRDGLGDIGFPEPVPTASEEAAALALSRLTRERPGELTLVALAPLTNLALAVRLDPQLPQRIRRLVIMGGAIGGRGNTTVGPAEFNIGFDPEAADVVFRAFPQFDLVDWELTLRCAFDGEIFAQWLAAGDRRAHFFDRIYGRARTYNAARGRHGVIAADALAMAVAIAPQIVTDSVHHRVDIELDGRLTRGATVVDWESRSPRAANARLILDVDREAYAAMVKRALGAG